MFMVELRRACGSFVSLLFLFMVDMSCTFSPLVCYVLLELLFVSFNLSCWTGNGLIEISVVTEIWVFQAH